MIFKLFAADSKGREMTLYSARIVLHWSSSSQWILGAEALVVNVYRLGAAGLVISTPSIEKFPNELRNFLGKIPFFALE